MQTGARGVEVDFRRVVHDGELDLILRAALLKPALAVFLGKARNDRLLDDLLTVRNGMQRRVQAVSLDRKCAVRRDEFLPRQRLHAFEKLVERLCAERAQSDEHALCAAQIKVRPRKRALVALEKYTAVFRAYIGQLAAEAKLVRDDALKPEQRRAAHGKFHFCFLQKGPCLRGRSRYIDIISFL